MSSPVALIIFNRPNETERVFSEIAKAKPEKLFVIADGPRDNYPEDKVKCEKTRRIVDNVDWKCEVFKNYSETNLGCGLRPASGISWVFEHVEEAIILEDDCVPNPTFFPFCDELLQRYRNDKRIMMVGGTNTFFKKISVEYSYFFAKVPTCWGWATWRRAWKLFDMDMKQWPLLRDTNWLTDYLGDHLMEKFWWKIFNMAYEDRGHVHYWDYQWAFSCLVQHGLYIVPKVNLISNIGWNEDATHTKNPKSASSNVATENIEFPLSHPPYFIWNRESDKIRFDQSPQAKKVRTTTFHETVSKLLPDSSANLLRRWLPNSLKRMIKKIYY